MYDKALADRVGQCLLKRTVFDAVEMFGGLAFMVQRHMCCGVLKEDLILRVDRARAAELVRTKKARYFDFTGTPMKSIVTVRSSALKSSSDLHKYVLGSLAYAKTLPPKKSKKKRFAKGLTRRLT